MPGDSGMPGHVAHVENKSHFPAWLPAPGQGCQGSQEKAGSCHLGLLRALAYDRSHRLLAPHPSCYVLCRQNIWGAYVAAFRGTKR